jgi:hypothetical protein
MSITLGGITLPADLAWPDRYAWPPVVVNTNYSLTGALIAQSAERLAGRPITLQSADGRAWVDRTTVDALTALQAAGAALALSVRGQSFTVLILSVEAAPLWDWGDDSDPCTLTLKLIEM